MKWRDCRAPAPETSLQGPGWASRAQVSAASGAGWVQREQRLEGPGVRGAAHGWGHSGGAQRPPPSPAGEGPRGDSLEETQVVPRCGGLAAQAHVLKAHAGACGEDGAEGDKALRLRTMGPRGLDVRASSCEQRWVKLSGWDGNTGSGLSRWWGGR